MCTPLVSTNPEDIRRFFEQAQRQEEIAKAERNGYEPVPAFECKGCGFVNRGMVQFCEQCRRPR